MDHTQHFNVLLESFGIRATCTNYQTIDGNFFYDLKLHPHAKVQDVKRYSDELSLALCTPSKPRIKVIHQEGIVRLEFAVPREKSLKLFDFFTNESIPGGKLNCLLGQTIDGQKVWMDLAANPHMLIAGTTGSGKSTLLHNIIANLFNYSDVDLYLVDPKQIEFMEYEQIKGHLVKVMTTYVETCNMLRGHIEIMEERYARLREVNVRFKPIVIIIDEFADLMLQDVNNEFHDLVCRLASKCRAVGMHLILATQRPSVNVISGSIKANFPARIACRVASHIDSRVILDAVGAEGLMGKGDALLRDSFRQLERFQIAYTTPQEVCQIFNVS